MLDLLLLLLAVLIAAYATYPPRGNSRWWLAVGMCALWCGLIAIGWRRGVVAGFEAWLVLLALMAAVIGVLVIWSATNLAGTPRQQNETHDPIEPE